jgi:uncharacterized protein YutE (UPF0331/DUF86 family)
MASTHNNLEQFFETVLREMVAMSPAVANLNPLLKKLLLAKVEKGDMATKQRVLRSLLKENHGYLDLAAAFQKKFGSDPAGYVKTLEAWVEKDIRTTKEADEHNAAQSISSQKITASLTPDYENFFHFSL